ncbi:tectonic-1-like isoform X2 [Saccostrea echinata]|uniref:tectonic-1-like isoform X2 n=1 Tax=Saccostrea echinata TaxID=191078 RepID=UPI002A83467F|nr:tectonic-1-like isoform X2 [Saccostrea echinata]
MAAKGNMVLVGTRILCLLFLSMFLTSVDASTTVETTTVNNTTVSTSEATTAETTTTEATTTQVQTTTTTVPPTTAPPIQTFSPSAVAANIDVGRCWCDVTGNACDINCCCDTECDQTDRASFDRCKESPVSVDARFCVQEEVILMENSVYTSEKTQDGLFCIYKDNNQERNYYTIPDMIDSLSTFNSYKDRYAVFTYSPTVSAETTYSQFYKTGDPIFVVYENLATGYLNIPQGDPYCSSNNPVSYLVDQSFKCTRQIRTLSATTCQTTSYLSASSYLTNIRIVKTPYLFTWIINGTEVTTPAPTTTAAPTTPAPTTVPVTTSNVQRSLYNNSYTMEFELERVECLDRTGLVVDCPFVSTSPPNATFNTSHCNNVVLGVEYHITHDGSNGISRAGVRLTIGSIQESDLPLTQTYGSSFTSVNEINKTIIERSGNPGYIVGKPVRAGVLVLNATGDSGNRYAIVEDMYNMTIIKGSATGTCLTDAGTRQQINFGINMASGCLIRFNLYNVSADQYCQAMQDVVIDAMEGVVDTVTRDDPTRLRRVATYGNSDPLKPGDWVQILREPPAPAAGQDTQDGPVCTMSLGMHTEILYAKTGALANPQPKIIGVSYRYEPRQDVTYTCEGSRCTPGNTEVDQSFEVRHSVTFIDASQPATGYVGEPPVFLAKVPSDFFYPFDSSNASQIRLFNYYHIIWFFLLCKCSIL